MRNALISIGLNLFFVVLTSVNINAQCEGNFNQDRNIDNADLMVFAQDFGRTDCAIGPSCEADIHPAGAPDGDVDGSDLTIFIADFGRTDCPLPVPANLFNIGNSIGEAEAADDTIDSLNHDTVWSTGYDLGDLVYSLNERFEDLDAAEYYENNLSRDTIFNRAISGSDMADFVTQADEVVVEASTIAISSGKAGMIAFLLGNNDVCAPSLNDMTDPALFELQYRAGLDVLAGSDATRNAYIHISGIPAIYWLWVAKRSDWVCRLIIWPFVPCENLLDNPVNDCASGGSYLDPDIIYPGDGDNCVRRKQFHAKIRDIYNPILRDVLAEYILDGRLPNAYYLDIFDIQFTGGDVNDGDCFHPSVAGHRLLAEEQWCRSPWGLDDPFCQ